MATMRYKRLVLAVSGLILLYLSLNVLAQSDEAPPPANVIAAVWSPDGSMIAGGGTDGYLRIWDAINGETIRDFPDLTETLYTLTWTTDSQRIISGGEGESLHVWDINSGQQLAELKWDGRVILAADVKPDGTLLAGISLEGRQNLLIWDLNTYELITAADGGSSLDIAWHPFDDLLAVANPFGGVNLFDSKGKHPDRYILVNQDMATVAWSPDGTKLVTGEADLFEPSDVYVWDVASQTRIAKIGEHAAQAQTWVTWSPDGQLITSIGGDEWLRIYDTAQEYREVQTLEKGMMLITDYGFSPYGGRLVYGAPLHDGQGLNDTDSAFSNGAVRVVVPVPSLARLDYIAPLCIVSSDSTEATRLLSPEAMETLTVEILPDFIAQVEALPERAIPAGCATDLIAVAEAVYSSQKNN